MSKAAQHAKVKERRQNRSRERARYEFLADPANYDYIAGLARRYCTSMAKVLNAILRKKPEPDEFTLR